jgi:multicomponent K+:H+ antiporter subunit E
MTRRLLPYPGLAAALFVVWILLTQSFSPGQVVLGLFAAIFGTQAMATLRLRPTIVRRWRSLVKLAAIVSYDIVRSNLAVFAIILTPSAQRRSAFIKMHLDLRNEHALAVLALIITATPGTAWVQFDRNTGLLLIHVFDLIDEEAWIEQLKVRYEKLLLEGFEQ